MDKRSSRLHEFVRRNVNLLLSKNDVLDEVKLRKFGYFRNQLKYEVGMPKNTEIARELCVYLVETKTVKTQEDIRLLTKSCPFMQKNIYDHDWPVIDALFETTMPDSVLTNEDIKQMKREDFRMRMEQELVESARRKIATQTQEMTAQAEAEIQARYREMIDHVQEREEKVAAKLAALEEIESEIAQFDNYSLEAIPYTPSGPGRESDVEGSLHWWEVMGLFDDPFPTVDGLSKIDEEHYDSLILKTPLFSKYLGMITQRPKEILNKTFILVGEYGSGKTTLFDYLKKPMITHDILPIHLLIDVENDAERIRASFLKLVIHEVAERYRSIVNVDPRSLFDVIDKEAVLEVLKTVGEAEKTRGIVIMLDGLHKDPHRIREALGFIQILQNTKDYWIRKGIDVGIIIAGSKEWERELDLNAAVRGSINQIDTIPSVSVDDSFQMLSKRLVTFSKNPEKPTKIRRAAVDRLHSVLKKKYSRDITFRDIVEEIMPHLVQTDLGYLEIAIPFDRDLLARLQNELEDSTEFKICIDTLRTRRPDALLPSVQLLSLLLERKGITEDDILFRTNQGLFAIMSGVGLIQKKRSLEAKNVWWIPSLCVLEFGRKVELKVGLKPSAFLVDLFERDMTSVAATAESGESITLRSLVASARSSDNHLANELQIALDMHTVIFSHARSAKDTILASEICSRTGDAIESILKCLYLTIEPRGTTVFFGGSPEKWLGESWIAPSEVFAYWGETRKCEGLTPDAKQAAEITRAYLRAFASVVANIERVMQCNYIVNLSTTGLRRADKVALNDIRVHFAGNRLFEACRLFTDFMENRTRAFVYDILTTKYGNKWRSRLGVDPNDYINAERTRSKTVLPASSVYLNDLYLLTPGFYRQIIAEDSANWNQIFKYCFEPETKEFIAESFHLIFAFRDKDKHNLDNVYFQENQDKLLPAIQRGSRLVANMNNAYVKLICSGNVFVEPGSDGSRKVCFSFMSLKDRSNLNPLVITAQVGGDVSGQIERKLASGSVVLDLADREGIEYAFGRKHRDTIGVLGIGIEKGLLSVEKIGASLVSVGYARRGQ